MIQLVIAGPRYMVLHRERHSSDGEYELHGGRNPTLFKTLKMAEKARRDGYTWIKASEVEQRRRGGRILLFDVNYLPELTADPVFEHPGLGDRLTELEICERQMQLWAERAAAVRSQGPLRCAASPTDNDSEDEDP